MITFQKSLQIITISVFQLRLISHTNL